MDLHEWIAEELADTRRRLDLQVLDRVPADRRLERPGGGSSILWGQWHTARHADLAVNGVLLGRAPHADPTLGGTGLGEAEDPIIDSLDPADVAAYATAVLDDVEARWRADGAELLAGTPDAAAALAAANVPADDYDWLYAMWGGKPATFFIRWEVIGHLANHTGEMIATRNRMGLSPF
jgi:hypothetical protein